MNSKNAAVLFCGFSLNAFATAALAAPVVISGTDNGSGLGAHPLSDAAAASFNLAAPPTNTITFESATVGNFTSFLAAPGVTVSQTNFDPASGITGVSADNTDPTLGFNTTVGGTKSLRTAPLVTATNSQLTFTFTTPVDAFGFYLTGTEANIDGTFLLTFNDGPNQSLPIAENAVAGTQFFGFTDAGASISSVTLLEIGPFNTRDVIGIDDVRYRSVPEPTALGIVAVVGLLRRRRIAAN